jgi:uncharacterized membrane protein
MLTTVLDLLGAACLVGFAYLLFPPAALAVAGVLFLLASRKANR